MSCCGGGGGDASAAARAEEAARQSQVNEAVSNINTQFAGFNDSFYNKRAQEYNDFALPQLGEQFQQMSRNLTYKLADNHMLDSSGARFLANSLNRETAKQRQGIVDMGLAKSQQLKKDVEGERATLINQAQLAADPRLATQGALAAASTYQMPSTFEPISNFLQGWGSIYLNNQIARTYDQSSRGVGGGNSFATTPTTVRT